MRQNKQDTIKIKKYDICKIKVDFYFYLKNTKYFVKNGWKLNKIFQFWEKKTNK